MSEFWAAIAGAIVGGAISFAIQMVALRESRSQRSEERKLETEALANSLLYKVIRLVSNIHHLHDHFVASVAAARTTPSGGEHWQIVLPIANMPDRIHFSADEMSMLLRQGDDSVFNSILEMDARHNALLAAAEAYNQNRQTLTDRISALGSIELESGQIIRHVLNSDALNAVRPKMIEVNSIAAALEASLTGDYPSAKTLMLNLHKLLRDKCGLKHKLEFVAGKVEQSLKDTDTFRPAPG